jgi:hypothetical protein
MKLSTRFAAVWTVALLAAGCAAAPAPTASTAPTVTPAPTASSHLLRGSFTLIGPPSTWDYVDPKNPTDGCKGHGGFDDFGPGMTVVVENESRTVIGTSATTPGDASFTAGCSVLFAVAVPDAAFYSVAVGHRGNLTYSAADLAAKGWVLDLSLRA